MISVGSEVQILPGPPNLVADVFDCSEEYSPETVPGGVAQLGEHLLCKQGVVGSNPIASTTVSVVLMAWFVDLYRGEAEGFGLFYLFHHRCVGNGGWIVCVTR